MTSVCASSQDSQYPVLDRQPGQRVMDSGMTSRLAIQFLMLLEPRQLMTMSWLVLSTAMKPVTSVFGEFMNLRTISVSANSTRLQSPPGHMTFEAVPL